MNDVLVAYGSKYGSTAEIAKVIAAAMREAGIDRCMARTIGVSDVGETVGMRGTRSARIGAAERFSRARGSPTVLGSWRAAASLCTRPSDMRNDVAALRSVAGTRRVGQTRILRGHVMVVPERTRPGHIGPSHVDE